MTVSAVFLPLVRACNRMAVNSQHNGCEQKNMSTSTPPRMSTREPPVSAREQLTRALARLAELAPDCLDEDGRPNDATGEQLIESLSVLPRRPTTHPRATPMPLSTPQTAPLPLDLAFDAHAFVARLKANAAAPPSRPPPDEHAPLPWDHRDRELLRVAITTRCVGRAPPPQSPIAPIARVQTPMSLLRPTPSFPDDLARDMTMSAAKPAYSAVCPRHLSVRRRRSGPSAARAFTPSRTR